MFAVIKTGGKQLKVAASEVVTVEKLQGQAGDRVTFGEVLMLGGDAPAVGAPVVEGAVVTGLIVDQTRNKKVIAFKKRRRQNSRRKKGHRQHVTKVCITEITLNGKVLAQGEARVVVAKAQTDAAVKAEAPAKAAKKTVVKAETPTAEKPAKAAKPAAEKKAPAKKAAKVEDQG